jgi:MerR family transcriptional regulator, thiopeptide resistance regulator
MDKRIVELSVGELAREAKVSIRTLHHYHAIGLLIPSHVGANGYRVYGRAEMLRLQEILFYRAVGMGLSEIAGLLAGKDDQVARLERHRERLSAEIARASDMLGTLKRTIAELKGDGSMANDNLYGPFPPEKQAEYEAWLIDTYGGDMPRHVAESREKVAAMTGWMREDWTRRLQEVEARLVALFEAGVDPGAEAAGEAVTAHRLLVGEMSEMVLPDSAYAGMAELYATHPDFIARYEQLSRGFSAWLPAAMKARVGRGA